MTKKAIFCLGTFLIALFWLAGTISSGPSPVSAQVVYQTPTPDSNGRIYYEVQPNDTCIRIALLTGISQDEIKRLNNLDANCTVVAGAKLLLGVVAPAATTPTGPAPTATPLLITPTPFNGTAEVCIFLYDDLNGDGKRQELEAAIPEGQISITDRSGKVSLTGTTAISEDPVCFTEVPEGDLNVSLGVPDGYNPTTLLNMSLKVMAGDTHRLNFGAQLNSVAVTPAPAEGGRSAALGLLGGLLLVAGAGLGLYVRRLGK
jgi:LysM repeat protein